MIASDTLSSTYIRYQVQEQNVTDKQVYLKPMPRPWCDVAHISMYSIYLLSGRKQTYANTVIAIHMAIGNTDCNVAEPLLSKAI
jgi:hypothetical protein